MANTDIDDLLDELIPEDEDGTEELEEGEKPEAKEEKKEPEKPKEEEKPKVEKKPVAITPTADQATLDAAMEAVDILSNMKQELDNEYPDLTKEEKDAIMAKIKTSGAKNLAFNYNADAHRIWARDTMFKKIEAGTYDPSKKKVQRETTSVGGGASRQKTDTAGENAVKRFNDPKLTKFFADRRKAEAK